MKTIYEIIDSYRPNAEYSCYYHQSDIEFMMKDYAKLWVEKCIREIADVQPDNTINYYLNQIEQQ